MRGRYKVFEGQVRPEPGIVVSFRIDCWNGKGLSAEEKQSVFQKAADWVTKVMASERQRTRERVLRDLEGTTP